MRHSAAILFNRDRPIEGNNVPLFRNPKREEAPPIVTQVAPLSKDASTPQATEPVPTDSQLLDVSDSLMCVMLVTIETWDETALLPPVLFCSCIKTVAMFYPQFTSSRFCL